MARHESSMLRKFAFVVADPTRTREDDAWAIGFRDALLVLGRCPDWAETFAPLDATSERDE